jgi:hypothetical protein
MPVFEITAESDAPRGWTFDVRLTDDDGVDLPDPRRLHLAWADYNLWSPDGADPPASVAGAVLTLLLDRRGLDLPMTIDAAVVRRLFPDADTTIPRLIRPA